MSNYTYRDYRPGDEIALNKIYKDTFLEFMDPAIEPEGVENFLKAIQPEVIIQRLIEGKRSIIVAECKTGIVGAVETKDGNHISMLFIDKSHHRQGIAKELMLQAINRFREINPNLQTIILNSSKYAIPFYEKLGFVCTGPERKRNSVLSTPMEMNVSNQMT
ncbi:MAG: GNAT family N-acetyltransferase [Negativicutes bacterium]